MGRNKQFKNVYVITIEGKTSNGFMASLFHTMLTAIVQSVGVGYQQVQTSIKAIETSGDFDAEKGEMKSEVK